MGPHVCFRRRHHAILLALSLVVTSCASTSPRDDVAQPTAEIVEETTSTTTTEAEPPQTSTTTTTEATTTTTEAASDHEDSGDFSAQEAMAMFDSFIEAEERLANLFGTGAATKDDVQTWTQLFDPDLFSLPPETRTKLYWECNKDRPGDPLVVELTPVHVDQVLLTDDVWLVQAALAVRVEGESVPTSHGLEFIITPDGFGGRLGYHDDSTCGLEISAPGLSLHSRGRDASAEQPSGATPQKELVPISAEEAIALLDQHLALENQLAFATRNGDASLELAHEFRDSYDTSLISGNQELNAHVELMCFEQWFGAEGPFAEGPLVLEVQHLDEIQINDWTWLLEFELHTKTIEGALTSERHVLITSNGVGPLINFASETNCARIENVRATALRQEAEQVLETT